MKPLLVGEDNPYHADPRFALYPAPDGLAGARLCYSVLGFARMRDYIAKFDRVNLCASSAWNLKQARDRAAEIISSRKNGDGPLVLLGAKVCKAFAVPYEPFSAYAFSGDGQIIRAMNIDPAVHAIVLPHPSGRNRAWNADGAYERARAVLRMAGVL